MVEKLLKIERKLGAMEHRIEEHWPLTRPLPGELGARLEYSLRLNLQITEELLGIVKEMAVIIGESEK